MEILGKEKESVPVTAIVDCDHSNHRSDPTHPGLFCCVDCGVKFFIEDRLYYQGQFHLPKDFWRRTIIYSTLGMAVTLGMLILRDFIVIHL